MFFNAIIEDLGTVPAAKLLLHRMLLPFIKSKTFPEGFVIQRFWISCSRRCARQLPELINPKLLSYHSSQRHEQPTPAIWSKSPKCDTLGTNLTSPVLIRPAVPPQANTTRTIQSSVKWTQEL